jgi:hypothetical protein
MSSIRLRPDQIARLPKGQGARVIRLALARYRKGEIVIQKLGNRKNEKEVLQVFALRQRLEIGDARLVREILDAHFRTPVDHSGELARWDAICAEMLDHLPPFFLE